MHETSMEGLVSDCQFQAGDNYGFLVSDCLIQA